MSLQTKRYNAFCLHGPVASVHALVVLSLLLSLTACSTTTMPAPPAQVGAGMDGGVDTVLTEYRSNQVEVTLVRQQYVWRLPDANQHLAQFAHHIQVDGSVPAHLQEFVVTYSKAQHLPRDTPADNTLSASLVDQLQISRNGQFMVSESISPAFTGEQSYRRLEAASLKVGNDTYVLTVANGFLHRPMWLAIFAADGKPVYRIGLPHGHWQLTEHADGISIVDTSGSGRRLLIRPEH
ncbi:hypothetical protein ACO0LG_27580 [Undibacterium sp. Ji42W]|uniref:hypothetical protein n=1 Tax=Undibacterium sp. Ji42W TaxID=3413039 RepID=UPI003BF22D20